MGAGPTALGRRQAAMTLLTLLLALGYFPAARYGDLAMRPGEQMTDIPGMKRHRM